MFRGGDPPPLPTTAEKHVGVSTSNRMSDTALLWVLVSGQRRSFRTQKKRQFICAPQVPMSVVCTYKCVHVLEIQSRREDLMTNVSLLTIEGGDAAEVFIFRNLRYVID